MQKIEQTLCSLYYLGKALGECSDLSLWKRRKLKSKGKQRHGARYKH